MACDDSDSSYDDEGPPLQPNTNPRGGMKLRNASRLKRPARYTYDLDPIDPGRPSFVHEDPVFNMDRAYFVRWPTLELDEPSPGEALHKLWQEQGEPRDAFGKPIVPSSPSRAEVQTTSSPGPTVAHLKRRQSSSVRPDPLRSIVNTVEQKDAFDEAFDSNLADFDDDEPQSNGGNVSRVVHSQLSPQYKDWSALKENVQWAIIYDLANDHQDGITAAANLLGLTMTEVINFVNLYLREKALWENGASQDENAHIHRALSQRDGAQDEDLQPVPEAVVDLNMRDTDPDHQHVAAGASQTDIIDESSPQSLERVYEIWNEPEDELFLEADNKVEAEERVDQPGLQADEEQAFLKNTPPLVELVTDSFSREDVASGRGYLSFVGLQEYADRFSEWFGTGTSFREIPGIFDENNELIFPTEDTKNVLYSGNELDWEGPAPQPLDDPAQREWLMQALPRDLPRPEQLEDLELQQFHAVAERINGHPIKPDGRGDIFLNNTPEGVQGGLNYGERVQTDTFVQMLLDDETADEEAAGLVQKEAEYSVGADNNIAQRISKTHVNLVPPGTLGNFGDERVRLLNTSSTMPHGPYMPQFGNGIPHRFPGLGNVGFDRGLNEHKSISPSHSLPPHQLPPVLQPHHDIVQLAGRAVSGLPLLGHENSQDMGTDQTAQAQSQDAPIATPKPTGSPSVKTSSNYEAPDTAENDKRDAQVTDAQSEVQEAAGSSRFSQNGIDTEGFPKCAPCLAARARCDGGRPCSSCGTRNRRCKDVTKEDLDKYPDRAERVIADRAKADAKTARDEGKATAQSPSSTPKTAVPATVVSTATTAGVKRKYSDIVGDTSSGKDDSDLDQFPPETEDPKDGDYDTIPKKKRAKKSILPATKKQVTAKGAPATSTPPKRGPRGPYKKKAGNSTPKTKSSGPGAGSKNKPTPQPGGCALSGRVSAATPAQKNSAKAPTVAKDKRSGLSRNAGEVGTPGDGAGGSVHDAAKAVRLAEGGMTNVRPVPVGKRGEPHSVLDPSWESPSLSDAGDARYLNIPFAPVGSQTHARNAPVSRPITRFPGASSSQGAYAMPGIPSHVMPPRYQRVSAGNNHLGGAGLPSVASSLNTRMAVRDNLPATVEGMPLVPQIARPGLSGPPEATDTSPTSQSSGSGTTVSMDFLDMPFSPAQGSPAYSHGSHGSMLGRMPQGSPGFSPGMVSTGSPTAPQRRLLASSHNNGAHGSVTDFPSPLTAAAPDFAVDPGLMSPYTMFPEQLPIPRPISRLHVGHGYSASQHSVPPFNSSGVFRGHRGEEIRSGSRAVSASPSHHQLTTSPRPPKRMADASSNFGQQSPRKKPKASDSPLAPPREAKSWKEMARTQWAAAAEPQENQPHIPRPPVQPLFGGDGSFAVSFSPIPCVTRIEKQSAPVLKEMKKARNPSSAGTTKKH